MKKTVPTNAILIPDNAKRVYKGIVFDVYQWPQQLYDGTTITYEAVKRLDTVNAICVVDNKIIILDEEQPHQGVRVSFPLGKVDRSDSSTLSAAQREVEEETGYSFANWRLIQVRQFHGKIEWFIYTYVAWGVKEHKSPMREGGEKISVRLETLKDLKKLTLKQNDYLSWSKTIFEKIKAIDDLLQFPEFKGQEVDR